VTWCVSATTYDKYKSWVRTNMKGSGLCHFIYYSHSRFSILLHRCTTSCMIFLTHTDIILFNHPEGELSCGKVTTRQAEFLADPWTFGVNIPLLPSTAGGDDTKHLLPLPRVLKFSDDGHSLIAVYFQHGIVWVIHHFIDKIQLIIMQDPGWSSLFNQNGPSGRNADKCKCIILGGR
jgi:hypothetical protein